jgi:hypothetical protein
MSAKEVTNVGRDNTESKAVADSETAGLIVIVADTASLIRAVSANEPLKTDLAFTASAAVATSVTNTS